MYGCWGGHVLHTKFAVAKKKKKKKMSKKFLVQMEHGRLEQNPAFRGRRMRISVLCNLD